MLKKRTVIGKIGTEVNSEGSTDSQKKILGKVSGENLYKEHYEKSKDLLESDTAVDVWKGYKQFNDFNEDGKTDIRDIVRAKKLGFGTDTVKDYLLGGDNVKRAFYSGEELELYDYDLKAGQAEISLMKKYQNELKDLENTKLELFEEYFAGDNLPEESESTDDYLQRVARNDNRYQKINARLNEIYKIIDKDDFEFDGLEKAIEEKENYYKKAKNFKTKNNDAFKALESEDFEKYSKLKTKKGFGDVVKGISKIINLASGDIEELREAKTKTYMTDTEREIYKYYKAKESKGLIAKGTADKYYSSIKETLNYRESYDIADSIEGKTALELSFGVWAGLDQFSNGAKNFFNFSDEYIPVTATQMASEMIREDLGTGWRVVYDLTTTISNMAPSLAIGIANPAAGAAIMGVSAAGNSYQSMLNEGYNKEQSRIYSSLVGISEAGLQYALGGIENLGGKLSGKITGKTMGAICKGAENASFKASLTFGLKSLGANMLSEGSEEFIQDMLEPVFKSIATGEKMEAIDWSQATYDAFLGALSAGVIEGGGIAIKGVSNLKAVSGAKKITSNINLTPAVVTNAVTEIQLEAVGNEFINTAPGKVGEIISYAVNSENSEIRSIAEAEAGNKSSDPIAVGKLYKYALESINNEIGTTESLTEAHNGCAKIIKVNPPSVIKGIALIQLHNKAIEYVAGKEYETTLSSHHENLIEAPKNGDIASLTGNYGTNKTEDMVYYTPELMTASGNDPFSNRGTNNLYGNKNNSLWIEPDVHKPNSDLIEDTAAKLNGNIRLSREQREVVNIAGKLGSNVIFENIKASHGSVIDGYISDGNVIHIDYNCERPLTVIFKHELTHFSESSPNYNAFANAALKSSPFREWISNIVAGESAYNYSTDSLISFYIENTKSVYLENGVSLTYEGAKAEMIAEFVGDTMFNENSGETLSDILRVSEQKQHNAIVQFIIDFVRYIRERFKGNNEISFAMIRLEGLYGKALKEANGSVERNAVERYSFVGRNAVDADLKALEKAEQDLDAGVNPNKIRKETGWYRGVDYKWRYEISNQDFNVDLNNIFEKKKLGEIISECKILESYPQFADIKISFFENSEGMEAYYDAEENEIAMNAATIKEAILEKEMRDFYANFVLESPALKKYRDILSKIESESDINKIKKKKEFKSIIDEVLNIKEGRDWFETVFARDDSLAEIKVSLLHEIQHAIQDIEGFESGSSLEEINMLYEKGLYAYDDDGRILTQFEAYLADYGEREARDASERMYFSDSERKKYPPDLAQVGKYFSDKYVKRYALSESNNSSIKQRISENFNKIKNNKTVFSADVAVPVNKAEASGMIVDKFRELNYCVERKKFGKINVSETQLYGAMLHMKSKEQIMALLALPEVLKNGTDVFGEFGSLVVFAEHIAVNHNEGIMSAAVGKTEDGDYRIRFVIMPDGTKLDFVGFEDNTDVSQEKSNFIADSDNTIKSPDNTAESRIREFLNSPYYSVLNEDERNKIIGWIYELFDSNVDKKRMYGFSEQEYNTAVKYDKEGELINYLVTMALEGAANITENRNIN